MVGAPFLERKPSYASGRIVCRSRCSLLAAAVAAAVLDRLRAHRIRRRCWRRWRHGWLAERHAASRGRGRHRCSGCCSRISRSGHRLICWCSGIGRGSLIGRCRLHRGIGRSGLRGGVCRWRRLGDHGRREKSGSGEKDGLHVNLLNGCTILVARRLNALSRAWVLRFASDSIRPAARPISGQRFSRPCRANSPPTGRCG